MHLSLLFSHFLHFLLPAVAVGAFLALFAPLVLRRRWVFYDICTQAAINALAGAAVLGLGLWWFGNDGKLLTYGVLAVVCGCTQWWGLRG